ncbi:GNAT family N-acetyltransferase [Solirubrobacter ginsenosidimutans]|uniref:GNAT family N-acetyltransferase n=1 Tax=Solirubrobacter ginsenosidimutans TaxID=490573 RepID=A0A9X3MW48_9ACTN|nr:GNAT family N-acetyltransferase [Solirubrobacter ginsenosidimutans]MDA0163764.1 GNAT family N-acetyltransferase [Solirubrobacter ginsenosidimutans]
MIRNATSHDFPAVLALWGEARSGHAETEDTLEAIERLDDGALLVYESDQEIVGALIAAFDGWRGNMYRLAVTPGHRRAGIARRLVEAGETRLKAQGAPKVTALVGRGDTQAEGLWRAAGYKDDVEIGRWVRALG